MRISDWSSDVCSSDLLDTLITQNVDGLHLRAGTSRERLVEIHGTTTDVMCLDCDERAPIEKALDRVRAGEEDPACRSCGGLRKTATIPFAPQPVPHPLPRAGAPRSPGPLCGNEWAST